MPRFSTFRTLLTLFIALTASTSLSLSAFLIDSFQHYGIGWLIIVIEICSILRCAWSMSQKHVFSRSHSVALEAVGLFVLSPFQLIIVFVIPSSPPVIGTNPRTLAALKGLAIASAVLHLGFAVGLIAICTLTIKAYDADVWLRDIDSSPSPFPLDILFAFVFPSIARRFSATESLVPSQMRTSAYPDVSICPPDCGCQGGVHTCLKETTTPSPPQGVRGQSQINQPVRLGERRRPPILARNLIRVPNSAERRATIIVELPVFISSGVS